MQDLGRGSEQDSRGSDAPLHQSHSASLPSQTLGQNFDNPIRSRSPAPPADDAPTPSKSLRPTYRSEPAPPSGFFADRASGASLAGIPRSPCTPEVKASTTDSSTPQISLPYPLTPRTPQTPGVNTSMSSSISPILQPRRPRHRRSASTDAVSKDSAIASLLENGRTHSLLQARVRFTPETRSPLPKLPRNPDSSPIVPSTSPIPNSPTVSISSTTPTPTRHRSTSSSRRRSADISAAAAASGRGTWQRRVAEELVRMSSGHYASNQPVSSPISSYEASQARSKQHRRKISGSSNDLSPKYRPNERTSPGLPFPQENEGEIPKEVTNVNRGGSKLGRRSIIDSTIKKSDKENVRRQKVESLLAYSQRSIEVYAVKDDASETRPTPWRLDIDIPSASLGPSQRSQRLATEQSADPVVSPTHQGNSASDNATSPSTTEGIIQPRPVRRRPKKRSQTSVQGTETAEGNIIGVNAESGPSTPRVVISSVPLSTSPTSLRPHRSTPILPSPSQQPLGPPEQSANAISPISPESPDTSPATSRRRLSSYTETTSLFFAPRSNPPEEYPSPVQPPPSASTSSRPASSYLTAPQTPAESTPRPTSASLMPGQVRLVPPEDGKRESDAASLGKGKGKRLGPDDEAQGESSGPSTLLGVDMERERKVSRVSRLSRYTDDDVLSELPVNPRKRVKLSTSKALVQSLTDAVEARSRHSPSEDDSPPREKARSRSSSDTTDVRASARRRNVTSMPPVSYQGPEHAGPSRPSSSRRSHSVSFSIQGDSSQDTSTELHEGTTTAKPRRRRPRSLAEPTTNTSIPLMAFISPRPASLVVSVGPSRNGHGHNGFHLREPRRYSQSVRSPTSGTSAAHESSSGTASSPSDRSGPPATSRRFPLQGWAFFLGFVFPFCWWIAALLPVHIHGDIENGRAGPHGPLPTDRLAWRRRCRLISIFSIIVYIPVIVLAVVFGR